MRIRNQRIWCPTCTAPELWHSNLPLVELYLEALPAWRTAGMGGQLMEGFDRAEIAALMDLRAIEDRPGAWAALAEMEAETRRIRAAQAKAKQP